MRKWQKISLISVLATAALVAFGIIFYKFYIVPKHIEPIAEKLEEYVNSEGVIESLYADIDELHDSGVITDAVYNNFVKAYTEHTRDDLSYAYQILNEQAEEQESDGTDTSGNSLSAKYASNKVGIEIVQVNDNADSGKSQSTYSSSRTTDRRKAEDIVEAEKIVAEYEEAESDTGESSEEDDKTVKSAYQKLKENMEASEFSTFTAIMGKLDINTLHSYFNSSDKEGLKTYLHSHLSDSEYNEIINLGYKYAYLFMDDND